MSGATAKPRTLGEYLRELESTKEGRDEQVRQGLEIYVDLWRKAVDNGVVSESEKLEDALSKVEAMGGLYKAAED